MTMKFNAVLAAVLATGAVGAQAALDVPSASSFGNGSILFAAHDQSEQITLIVDLGLNMTDFDLGAPIHAAGNRVTWNFSTSTVTGINTTGNDWTTAYNLFKSTQSGGDYKWAVIAGDSVNVATVTSTNVLAGRGYMASGNPTAAELVNTNATTSSPIGNALGVGALQGLYAAANNLGNIATANNGAGTATSGTAYGVLIGQFNGAGAWNYMVADKGTSAFTYLRQVVANPVAYQFGAPVGVDVLSGDPSTFTFDISTNTLVWQAAPIPEPGTYALMLAGLVGVAYMARRRAR